MEDVSYEIGKRFRNAEKLACRGKIRIRADYTVFEVALFIIFVKVDIRTCVQLVLCFVLIF